MEIESKLPDVGVTIFSIMSQLAMQHGAINLSQGFPDFEVDPDLIGLVNQGMLDGYNQYAPSQGVLSLRKKISEKAEKMYNRRYDPATEITITSGATEALYAAITATVRSGDEVLIFEPAFDSYVPVIRLNGGVPVFVKHRFPGYHIDWDDVGRAITPRTRLMILNSPHNPTGSVLSEEDVSELKKIVSNSDILILSDEVYEHIIFDGMAHKSMALYPELAERSFVVSSFGKTYHTTGWKIGYCLAPRSLSTEFQRVHQFLTFASNTPVQHAYGHFLENEDAFRSLSGFYQKKRDMFLDLIRPSGFRPEPCHGTYFMMLDYSSVSKSPDTQFAREMTIKHKVASIPPSVFYHNGDDHLVLRFCFAKKDETLKEAAEKLCRI
jgi:methionine transaminase